MISMQHNCSLCVGCRYCGDYRMGIRERLINFVYSKATGPGPDRRMLTSIAPLFFLSLIIFIIFVAILLDQLLGLPEMFMSPLNIIIAIPFLALGSFLWMWSLLHFFKSKGTPVPFNPPPKMVSGVVITISGVGVLLKSISLAFIFTPVLYAFIYIELKAIEEPELELRLGEAYREYRKRVPMFFPRLGSKRKDI